VAPLFAEGKELTSIFVKARKTSKNRSPEFAAAAEAGE